MKFQLKIISLIITLSLSIGISVYAYTESEIQSQYVTRIANLESQRDTKIQELETIYNDSLLRNEGIIKDAKVVLEELKTSYGIVINSCTAQAQNSGLVLTESEITSLIRDCTKKISTQIATQESTIAELNTRLSSIQTEKESKITQLRNYYKIQIDALIIERDTTIQGIKNIETNKQVTGTNTQTAQQNSQPTVVTTKIPTYTELQNSANEEALRYCYSKLGGNATIQNGQCACKEGYSLGSTNICISKKEIDEEYKIMLKNLLPACQTKLGGNATIDSKGACVCKDGYELGVAKFCGAKSYGESTQVQVSRKSNVATDNTEEMKEYKYEKNITDFKKSKVLSVNTDYSTGSQVRIYKIITTESGGTRDILVAKVRVGKNGKITYRLKNHGKYKVVQ